MKKRSAIFSVNVGILIAAAGPSLARLSLAQAEHSRCAALFRSWPKLDTSKQAADFIAAVRDPADTSFAPEIWLTEFTSLESYDYTGAPKSFFTATYQGEKVLLKLRLVLSFMARP